MKILAFALFVIGAVIVLAQIWLQPFAHETFVKLIATDAILLALVGGWALFARERRESERLDRDKKLD